MDITQNLDLNDISILKDIAYRSILELETEDGILASGREEAYGCLFGRDSAICILVGLKLYSKLKSDKFLKMAKRTLTTLISLQGKKLNLENGEEPGKFIHEYRKDNFSRLLTAEKPWFVEDGVLKNYDSVDSTPLVLIALYKYLVASKDKKFIKANLSSIIQGLNWILEYGDLDNDGLLEYRYPDYRKSGGLYVQSWTDSLESILKKDGTFPKGPIAPIEVQSFAWLALTLWAHYFIKRVPAYALSLSARATKIKEEFNKKFIIEDQGLYFGAQALDGDKNQIKTVTINPLMCLWSTRWVDEKRECIVEDNYIESFVKRVLLPDMFVPHAGIRTMSALSSTFNPNQDSYHNGSIWPLAIGLGLEGVKTFGFKKEAKLIKEASLKPLRHFKSPIELYTVDHEGNYLEYKNSSGQVSCKNQAWTAFIMLDWLTD